MKACGITFTAGVVAGISAFALSLANMEIAPCFLGLLSLSCLAVSERVHKVEAD